MTLLLFLACAQPVHMQYDFGRATWESQRIQADRARASAAEAAYPLSGDEAMRIHANETKAATDEESGKAETIQ